MDGILVSRRVRLTYLSTRSSPTPAAHRNTLRLSGSEYQYYANNSFDQYGIQISKKNFILALAPELWTLPLSKRAEETHF